MTGKLCGTPLTASGVCCDYWKSYWGALLTGKLEDSSLMTGQIIGGLCLLVNWRVSSNEWADRD